MAVVEYEYLVLSFGRDAGRTEIRRALTVRSGPYAGTLALVESYERAGWDVVTAEAQAVEAVQEILLRIHLAARHDRA